MGHYQIEQFMYYGSLEREKTKWSRKFIQRKNGAKPPVSGEGNG